METVTRFIASGSFFLGIMTTLGLALLGCSIWMWHTAPKDRVHHPYKLLFMVWS
jgi:hypothetical protein